MLRTMMVLSGLAGLLLAQAPAQAAPRSQTYGFALSFGPVGGGEAHDPEMTVERIRAAVLSGFADAGLNVEPQSLATPAVTADFKFVYYPQLNNLRVLSGTIALRDKAVLNGRQRIVALCDSSVYNWRAGTPDAGHVEGILRNLRDAVRSQAMSCLSKLATAQ